jgi:hypothetical protein
MKSGSHDGSNRHDYFQGVRGTAMRRITVLNRRHYAAHRVIAGEGCEVIDRLAKQFGFREFHEYQEKLWWMLAEIEHRLQRMKDRSGERARRWKAWRVRTRDEAERRKMHRIVIDQHVDALLELRSILRQLGDSLAWAALRADPRYIAPLFDAGKTHHLPTGRGAIGPLGVLRKAATGSEFIVVDTDLTRCLGVGDLVVIRANGNWGWPMIFEVKTREVPDDPEQVAVWLIGAKATLSHEKEMLEQFASEFGYSIQPEQPLNERAQRQMEEMKAGRRNLAQLVIDSTKMLPVPLVRHWDTISRIIERAQVSGIAYDVAEPGLVYAAVRNVDGDLGLVEQMREKVAASGLTSTDWRETSTMAFQGIDELSAYGVPVALWKLPLGQRVEVICGNMIIFCFSSPFLWPAAFARHGQVLEAGPDESWIIRRNGRQMRIDAIEVKRMMVGPAFSAFSPENFAQRAAITWETLTLLEILRNAPDHSHDAPAGDGPGLPAGKEPGTGADL